MIEGRKKQTLIISAYKERDYLMRLLKWGSKHFNVFVHIDLKSEVYTQEDIDQMNAIPNVHVFRKYKVTWGSLTHLIAMFDMMRMALDYTDENGTIHTISGQDIPIKTYAEFDAFFRENPNAYMWFERQDEMLQVIKNRYELRDFLWRYNARAFPVRVFSKISFEIQKFFPKNRFFGGEERIFKGLIYASLPYGIVKYIVDYVMARPNYFKSIRYVRVPEEFFIQTIIANSPYREYIVAKSLGYMDWESKEAVLDGSYIEMLDNSDYFWARKVEMQKSKDVIDHYLGMKNG